MSGLRQAEELCYTITRESLERASIRILARRYHKARNTIVSIIRRVTSQLPGQSNDRQKISSFMVGRAGC